MNQLIMNIRNSRRDFLRAYGPVHCQTVEHHGFRPGNQGAVQRNFYNSVKHRFNIFERGFWSTGPSINLEIHLPIVITHAEAISRLGTGRRRFLIPIEGIPSTRYRDYNS